MFPAARQDLPGSLGAGQILPGGRCFQSAAGASQVIEKASLTWCS
jgi:hypothetical protein